jgi:hypothetical protein
MRSLASALSLEKFRKQMGPFALIQRPPGNVDQTEQMGLPMNAAVTAMARPEDISKGTLALLFQFDDLSVTTLPPLQGVDEISVGRLPDCELVIDHASVSKRHATLRWDDEKKRCTVEDLGSTNGTYLNASMMVRKETTLRDGDILSFGDVQFWYLLAETLHAKLAGGGSNKLGSRSG